ncbi:MAG: hypothetical protein CFH10_01376 [Alphaproteobacteria bacterium MarineAlpha4_Bin2]|nr:MAG: hypothetical protein CFH10_01376 [Alphaproteobacteria bacterium MarineAlpha4_Bin2]
MRPSNRQEKNVPGKIVEDLSAGVTGTAERVLIGLNWTIVVGPMGLGFAHTSARGTSGCNGLPMPGSYTGKKLLELSHLTVSTNVFEQAIGFAAINAHHNRFDLEGNDKNGLDLIEDHGERTVVIGQFPGLSHRMPNAAVIERDPRPGCYPESAAADLLPNATNVLITASSLTNGSLANLLALATNAYVVLVGPSAPLSPILFHHGIDAISGFIARDCDMLMRTVMEGGAVRAMKPHGRFLTLERQ